MYGRFLRRIPWLCRGVVSTNFESLFEKFPTKWICSPKTWKRPSKEVNSRTYWRSEWNNGRIWFVCWYLYEKIFIFSLSSHICTWITSNWFWSELNTVKTVSKYSRFRWSLEERFFFWWWSILPWLCKLTKHKNVDFRKFFHWAPQYSEKVDVHF